MIWRSSRLVRRVSTQSRIDEASFVHEYRDNHYTSLHAEEFKKLYQAREQPLWPGLATRSGTEHQLLKNEKSRRPSADLPGHLRASFDGRVVHSSLGFGTYSKDAEESSCLQVGLSHQMFNALLDSLYNGSVNTIDTAPHWGFQRSERTVGAALQQAFLARRLLREEVFVCSRVGHLEVPACHQEDADSGRDHRVLREELAQAGVGADQVFGMHCFEPRFLARQAALSRRNLSLETLDLLYLHNPEALRGSLGYQAALLKVEKAFEQLESLRRDGSLVYYGVSSFAGFRAGPKEASFLGLQDLKRAAERVGGSENGLQYICLPVNVAMLEAFLDRSQPRTVEGSQEVQFVSTLQLASELRLNMMACSPFMSGFLHQVPLPTSLLKSRYLAVKHLNLVR